MQNQQNISEETIRPLLTPGVPPGPPPGVPGRVLPPGPPPGRPPGKCLFQPYTGACTDDMSIFTIVISIHGILLPKKKPATVYVECCSDDILFYMG